MFRAILYLCLKTTLFNNRKMKITKTNYYYIYYIPYSKKFQLEIIQEKKFISDKKILCAIASILIKHLDYIIDLELQKLKSEKFSDDLG